LTIFDLRSWAATKVDAHDNDRKSKIINLKW